MIVGAHGLKTSFSHSGVRQYAEISMRVQTLMNVSMLQEDLCMKSGHTHLLIKSSS